MKNKRLLRLVVPISVIVAMVVVFFTGCLPAAAPPPAAPPAAPGAPAAPAAAVVTEDELAILGHLINSNEPGVEYPIGPTINIGFLCALSGPDSGWGLPGITGNTIFMDCVNKTGGLLVGGIRYPLKMYEFDDEAIASKALQGARQLVLENDVRFISAIGGNPADAVHPFLTEHGVVYASLISTDIMPDRPYCIAGGDVTPRIDMLRPLVVKNFLPRPEELGRPLRWAVTSQDDTLGRTCQAWEVGCAVAEGWEIVYDKHFALETTDFAPVATAMMATNPDAMSLNLCYPTFQTLLWEQFYLQGWEGPISLNYIDWEANLQKIPPEYAAKCLGIDSFPVMEDEWWGEPSWNHSFTRIWNARYGPGGPEDVHRHMTGIDFDHVVALIPWARGCQLAGQKAPGAWPDNDAVLEALRAEQWFPTILGPGFMYGEEMWGIDNMISPPVPINKFDINAVSAAGAYGEKRIFYSMRFEPWFETIKDTVIRVVEEHGMMWYQRK